MSVNVGTNIYCDRAYLYNFPIPNTVLGHPAIFPCMYRNSASGLTQTGFVRINSQGKMFFGSGSTNDPLFSNDYENVFNEIIVHGIYVI